MNRKTSIIIQLVILTIMFTVVCSFAGSIITKSGYKLSDKIDEFFDVTVEEGNIEEFNQVQKVIIDTSTYNITIKEHNSQNVIVQTEDDTENGVDYKLYQEDGILYFKQEKRLISIFSEENNDIIIKVPQSSQLDYEITNLNGDITLNVNSKNIIINNTNGDILLNKSGENVVVKNASGDIKLYDTFTNIETRTVSGDISLVCSSIATNVQAKTTSGDIQVAMAKNLDYICEYKTTSGKVVNEYTGISGEKMGTFTNGEQITNINLRTVSGDITLENWLNVY